MLRARFSRWTRAREQVRERRERAREEREAGGDTGGADGGGRLVSCCAEERARVDDDVVARACVSYRFLHLRENSPRSLV